MKKLITITLLVASFIFAGCTTTQTRSALGVGSWDEFKDFQQISNWQDIKDFHSYSLTQTEIDSSLESWGVFPEELSEYGIKTGLPHTMEFFYNKKEDQLNQ